MEIWSAKLTATFWYFFIWLLKMAIEIVSFRSRNGDIQQLS